MRKNSKRRSSKRRSSKRRNSKRGLRRRMSRKRRTLMHPGSGKRARREAEDEKEQKVE